MTAAERNDIFQLGDLLNNTYRIESILGRGGTSEVYKARSDISGRVMAVKALRSEFASNDEFLVLMTREEDVREIRHDAVVRYFDTQRTTDGVVYLVMEHVDGPDLDEKLESGGMSAHDLMIIGQRVCEGLVAAHGRNIVHRDLSPDNIILRNDIPSEAVIIDFGIAKDTNPGAETIVGNEFAGKFAYAAPEQLAGQTDARSDLYSLGALLLATFRGRTPFVGDNLIEVVKNKALPLNTDGVPEPLCRLINRMTDPDPKQRFQSAEELLAAFKDPDSVEPAGISNETLSEATIISPVSGGLDAATVMPSIESITKNLDAPIAELTEQSQPAEVQKTNPARDKKGKGGLVFALLAVAAIAGGGVAYTTGLLDTVLTPYPTVSPYTLVVEKTPEGTALASGHVPSPEVLALLEAEMTALDGATEITIANGASVEAWGDGMLSMVDSIAQLDEFRLEISDGAVSINGLAGSQPEREAVQAAFQDGFPDGFSGTLDIELGPRFLQPSALERLIEVHSDCGKLQLLSPPPLGFGFDDTIIVSGRFASAETRQSLETSLRSEAGDRTVRVEGEVLNQTLCQIDALLPKSGSGGFDVRFGYGDRGAENLSGRYKVGENPTIDIRLPDEIQNGYLWVSIVDVQGIVFHLLPNLTRSDNSVESLRTEAEDGFVRVAYGLTEASSNGRLAFTVDGTVLGKSKVLVLHSDAPLFPDLRPTTESAASYAEALLAARDSGELFVRHLDTAILETEE